MCCVPDMLLVWPLTSEVDGSVGLGTGKLMRVSPVRSFLYPDLTHHACAAPEIHASLHPSC